MHLDIIRTALRRTPFEPFELRLMDGRSIGVSHPELVAISPRQVVVVSSEDESVTRIEPLPNVSLDLPQC